MYDGGVNTLTRWTTALILLGAVAGCAEPLAGSPGSLAPPSGPVPDLAGTWSGTWSGQPARLVVTGQGDTSMSGVNIGTWPLLGRRLPGVSGVLTFASGGQPTTVHVRGYFGESGGRPTLMLESVAADGPSFTLTEVAPERLAGVGTSSLPWHPRGTIQLQRER
jgi:hypothetical protein